MNKKDLINKIRVLEEESKLLPSGYLTTKNIKGKIYNYYRYYKDGRRVEKYIDKSLVFELSEKIELRKSLNKEVKELKKQLPQKIEKVDKLDYEFKTIIKTGKELLSFSLPVIKFKKRECFSKLNDYLYNDIFDKVLILYGLRRTGKTTLIKQAINEMDEDNLVKTAFIQIKENDTLSDLNKDLILLLKLGYKYIFIDEVTLLEDFIDGAALLSDVYASSGIKIVLSGTDSLGFMLSKSDQLYDRSIFLHTTFIPYREFENVLNVKGIEEYIRFGGTMSLSGIRYNDEFIFEDVDNSKIYVDSAIAKNIQHSLKHYQNGIHFRNLIDLFNNKELTNVINRVVEDINHRFTKDVLTKKFKSNDLAISKRNLRSDSNTILDEIDDITFTKNLKKMLEILDKEEQIININEIHALEIKEYLKLLDIICDINIRSFPNINEIRSYDVITQPGLRYAQVNALIDSLIMDKRFNELSFFDMKIVIERISNEIKGRMMEDIILLETKLANTKKEVFKLQFAVGEFDMVVFDKEKGNCEIYEIKYSKQILSDHYKHLIDEEKLRLTYHKFGNITKKVVLYRGNTISLDEIQYKNVEEYLMELKSK